MGEVVFKVVVGEGGVVIKIVGEGGVVFEIVGDSIESVIVVGAPQPKV